MAHSRIIQLSVKPFENEDYFITEDSFVREHDGWSPIFSVADYVNDDIDREEDIEWFVSTLGDTGFAYNKEEQSIVFDETFKAAYFAADLQKFLELAKEIEDNNSLFYEDGTTVWRVKQALEETFGFYVYDDGEYEKKMARWLREDMQPGQKYYFGGVVDYHF